MTDWQPTTEQMRNVMIYGSIAYPGSMSDGELRDAFDRWMNSIKRFAWFEGAASRQCRCAAYSEGECACGMYPSERNPYALSASTTADGGDTK